MDYLVLLLVALLFLYGFSGVGSLIDYFSDIDRRRSLTIRVAGFFAMSAWLHLMPKILLTIYMRENHFLAPELFSEDVGRTVLAGAYITPKILFAVILLSWGAIYKKVIGLVPGAHTRTAKWTVIAHSVLGAMAYIVFIYGLWSGDKAFAGHPHYPTLFLFVLLVSLTVSAYLILTLLANLEATLKFCYAPLLLILAVTAAVFYFSPAVANLVETQLNSFSSGGIGAKVKWNDLEIKGRLLMVTGEAVYLEVPSYPPQPYPHSEYFGCVLRLPGRETLVETSVFFLNKNAATADYCNLKNIPMSE